MSQILMQNRRQFLKLSTRLAALGMAAGAGFGKAGAVYADAGAIEVDDYKALVCIYLNGGNDANNMIVPVDTARYTAYQNLRGGLALGANKLLPAFTDAAQNPYALHYGLTEINDLYDEGTGPLAFVLNVGMLDRPLTRTQYQQGAHTPTNLFSHSDQTVQAQTGMPTINGTGWGGRLLDFFGNTDSLAAVSVSWPALFLQGYDVGGNSVPPGTNLSLAGMNLWQQSEATARKQAVQDMLLLDGGNTIRKTANQMFADGLHLAQTLQSASGTVTGTFPGTSIGNQLKEVARLIQVRAEQGPGRQVFFCSLDGFDLHSGQDWTHWYLLSSLSQALGAFWSSISSSPLGLADKVVAFTQSEFSRTFQPSGSGSDHAWGAHQLVLGGAVKGGVYGVMPTFAYAGPDDANTRGVWIPTISTAQFGATLGTWFGASEADIAQAFPNLQHFSQKNLGFME